MTLFLVVCVTLGVLALVHVAWWRMRAPLRQRESLMGLFLGGGLLLAPALAMAVPLLGLEPLSWVECVHAWIAVAAAGTAYVVTYSAVEADSPTLGMARYIASKGKAGCDLDELRQFMRGGSFVRVRLEAMVGDGMIEEREGRIVLGRRRQTLLRLVLWYWDRVLAMGRTGG